MDEQCLIDAYIVPALDRPTPDEALVLPGHVKVWAIIGHLATADGQVAQVAADYALPAAAVHAARARYRRHRAAIDARLAANAAPPATALPLR